MKLSQTLSALTLAFSMVGGAIVLAPSASEAASKKGSHINYDALKKDRSSCKHNKCRPGGGSDHNRWKRGCSAITRCRG